MKRMWSSQHFRLIDFRLILILFCLMCVSLLVISSTTSEVGDFDLEQFFTSSVKKQIQFFVLGWVAFLFLSGMDYNKLREWTWILYFGMILLLVGLFFVPSIQNVHRWYRLGGLAFQPSEYAKLGVIIALSWFLEKRGTKIGSWSTALQALGIVAFPFLLILKQPDLGTAFVLFPICHALFYIAGIRKSVVISMTFLLGLGLICSSLFFLEILDHKKIRPIATKFLKEYQYERLNPRTYHQKAAQIAIGLGGIGGAGWQKSNFTKRHWLPAAHTDSVFPAFAEEFGWLGSIFLLGIFFGLVYVCFQVTLVAKDAFGKFLSLGIAIYLGMHIVINLGMMCGFLPITGVPLVLISYGGSSILANMSALGILQSIYSRRYIF